MHCDTGKRIYLEYNMIIALLKEEDSQYSQKVKELFDNNYVFPYSPAHIEEVAVIYQTCQDTYKTKEYVKERLDYISKISRNWEFLPDDGQKAILRIECESPYSCMKRVMNDYVSTTLLCEYIEKYLMSRRTRIEFEKFCHENNVDDQDRNGIITDDELQKMVNIKSADKLSQISPEDIFELEEIKKLSIIRLQQGIDEVMEYKALIGLSSLDEIPKYCNIKYNYPAKEGVVNFLIKILHSAGYNAEKKRKSRSFMHDITHAIYATGADFFVNDDFASRQKIKAVYSFLEMPCKILSKSEFIERDFA